MIYETVIEMVFLLFYWSVKKTKKNPEKLEPSFIIVNMYFVFFFKGAKGFIQFYFCTQL